MWYEGHQNPLAEQLDRQCHCKQITRQIHHGQLTKKESCPPVDQIDELLGRGHVHLGTKISSNLWKKIIIVFRNHHDTFMWEGEITMKLNQCIAFHKLNINPTFFTDECRFHLRNRDESTNLTVFTYTM